MTFHTIVILLVLLPLITLGQSPYDFNGIEEAAYWGLGIGTISAGAILHKNTAILSESEINSLNRADINAFDRRATHNYSRTAAQFSDGFLYGSHLLGMFLLGHKKIRTDFKKIALLYGETIFITYGLTGLTKNLTKRKRPFVYNENVPIDEKFSKSASYSFFSGHVSVTATNCFFAAKVFSDYFPDSKLKPFVWSTAIIAPVITGYLRVKAGKHYPTDAMAGYTVGALVGLFVPHLHKIQKGKAIQVMPGVSGINLLWKLK